MRELSLHEFMRQKGLTQKAAGALLGKTQGGIGYILRDIQKGAREMRIVLDDQDQPMDALFIKRVPLPKPTQQAA